MSNNKDTFQKGTQLEANNIVIKYVKKNIISMAKLTRKLNFNVSNKVEIIYNPK